MSTWYALLVGVAVGCCLAGEARPGEPAERTVTVSATGQATARPDTMYVRFIAEGSADAAAEALKECRKNAEEAAKAIAALNVENAAVERKMYRFGGAESAIRFGARDGAEAGAKARVAQLLEVKVRKIQGKKQEELAEVLAKVIDAAAKAGLELADALHERMTGEVGPAAVEYALEDAGALREKALKDALARAKATLESLGLKVGKLKSVDCNARELAESPALWAGTASARGPKEEKAAFSASPDEVTVTATLTVTHEISE
jgi:uncharacterized protein YggE